MAVYVLQGSPVQAAQVGYASYNIVENTQFYWSFAGPTDGNIIAVTTVLASAGQVFVVAMPNASQVGVGYSFNLYNNGTQNIDIVDFLLNPIVTIQPGIMYWLQVTDNSTDGGVWFHMVYGAGTSNASANELAGYGLIAQNNGQPIDKLNCEWRVVTLTENINITAANRASFFHCTVASGLTVDNTPTPGFFFAVSNQSPGLASIVGNGVTIDNTDEVNLSSGQTGIFVYAGLSQWYSLGLTPPSTINSKVITINLPVSPSYQITVVQAQADVLLLTGAMSDMDIVLPVDNGQWTFVNETTFTLNISFVSGGNSYSLLPLQTALIVGDGSAGAIKAVPPIPLPLNFGGTNGQTKQEGFDNLSPTSSFGDIIYRGVTSNVSLPLPGPNITRSLISYPLGSAIPINWAGIPVLGFDPKVNTTQTLVTSETEVFDFSSNGFPSSVIVEISGVVAMGVPTTVGTYAYVFIEQLAPAGPDIELGVYPHDTLGLTLINAPVYYTATIQPDLPFHWKIKISGFTSGPAPFPIGLNRSILTPLNTGQSAVTLKVWPGS